MDIGQIEERLRSAGLEPRHLAGKVREVAAKLGDLINEGSMEDQIRFMVENGTDVLEWFVELE